MASYLVITAVLQVITLAYLVTATLRGNISFAGHGAYFDVFEAAAEQIVPDTAPKKAKAKKPSKPKAKAKKKA